MPGISIRRRRILVAGGSLIGALGIAAAAAIASAGATAAITASDAASRAAMNPGSGPGAVPDPALQAKFFVACSVLAADAKTTANAVLAAAVLAAAIAAAMTARAFFVDRGKGGAGLSSSISCRRRPLTGHQALQAGLPAVADRTLRLIAWLMPAVAGRRWLAEADSFLSEAPPGLRSAAIRDYLATAPHVIGAEWGSEMARQARRASAAASRRTGGNHDT